MQIWRIFVQTNVVRPQLLITKWAIIVGTIVCKYKSNDHCLLYVRMYVCTYVGPIVITTKEQRRKNIQSRVVFLITHR